MSGLLRAASTAKQFDAALIAVPRDAVHLVREAGHAIGGVLAACVNMLNPAQIAEEPLAGSVIACIPGVRGIPAPLFAG